MIETISGGLTITWPVVAGLVTLVVVVGPGFYWVGRLSNRVDHLEQDRTVIWQKIDAIHKHVKNGG